MYDVSSEEARAVRIADGASRYAPADDVAVITSYFNPMGYASRRALYQHFIAPFRAGGVPCLTVECAFHDQRFDLPASADVLQIRCRSLMWQKERLLNEAIARLPRHITKVVWIDCDVVFVEADWLVRTSAALERWVMIQPFELAINLPRGHERYRNEGERRFGFGALGAKNPNVLLKGDYYAHGHTGYAWAARRDVLDAHGLRDTDIAGSADHIMAHAACGDWNTDCLRRMLGIDNAFADDMRRWSRAFYADVRGEVGFVPGLLLHFWHGKSSDRQYVQRHYELLELGFDPGLDLRRGESGAWEWTDHNPGLRQWAERYFALRREDG